MADETLPHFLTLECPELDWTSNGDEFMHHVIEVASERFAADMVSWKGSTEYALIPYIVLSLERAESAIESVLCVFFTPNGVKVGVRDNSGVEPPADEVATWIAVLNDSLSRMKKDLPAFRWAAGIGVSTDDSMSGAQFLTNGFSIGGLDVEAAGSVYLDILKSKAPSLSSNQITWTYPVVVKGVAAGYEWFAASESVSRDLGRLCALLSVAFDEHWAVLESPRHFPNDGPIELARSRYGITVPGGNEDDYAHTSVSPPDWLTDEVWNRVVDDEMLETSLLAHHQALRLEEVSPSFALVAYVSSIEALGARMSEFSRCKECKMITGATARFRAALQVVMSEAEAKAMAKLVYGRRSKTAHEGRLYAGEMLPGFIHGFGFFAKPSGIMFRFVELRPLRQASRRLLVKYLVDGSFESTN